MENKDNIVRLLLFELVERIVRFDQHLEKVQFQFFYWTGQVRAQNTFYYKL